jgi:hypothetical protein
MKLAHRPRAIIFTRLFILTYHAVKYCARIPFSQTGVSVLEADPKLNPENVKRNKNSETCLLKTTSCSYFRFSSWVE